jgi:hypothetical protein
MKPSYFYLVCAGGELDIRVYNPSSDIPDQTPAYTITEITNQGWETYQVNRWRARDALPYVEAVYQALMACKASAGPP